MQRPLAWVVPMLLLLLPALHAGDKEKNKPAKPAVTPSERIEQLLHILKNDRKEDQRTKAADELGRLASAEYPEVVSGLIDALVRDDSSSVRKTVIKSLAGIQPETHEVKDALDQAVKQDKTWSVRQAARVAVWRYKPKDEPPSTPGPKLRNTSKPPTTGLAPAKKQPMKDAVAPDPFKSMPIPQIPTPVVPAESVPPPVTAPGPGQHVPGSNIPRTANGQPAQLTIPKPSGN